METIVAGNPSTCILFQCQICSQSHLSVVNQSGTLVVWHMPFSLHVSLGSLTRQEMVYDVRLFI